jgi:pimeloyl-ACP methyl ester carboxylesterase
VRLLVLTLSVLAVGAHPAAGPKLTGQRPCPNAPGFTCSTLTVPLDHSGKRAGTLSLQVAASDNTDAPRGVLLFLTGGPGQPGVPFAQRLTTRLGPIGTAYRVVLYDQRGTGAGALQCPALQAAMGSSDLTPPPAAAVRTCAKSLGAKRAYFGTDDVVGDMEALRQALGADTWSLDGVSYGTFVAERYAIAHPNRVDRLVLDSVVPHNAGFELAPIELRAAGRVLGAVCGRCADDLAAVVGKRHDGPQILDAITLMSVVDPTFTQPGGLARALREARSGNLVRLNALLSTAKQWDAAPADALSQGLHASALCADLRFPWGDSASPLATRAAKLAAAVARLKPKDLWPFDRATASGNGIEQQCLPWAPTPATPQAARRLPKVPTLLVNGDRDLSTPLEWARRELAVAPAGRLVVVHGAGHSVQSRAASDVGRNAVAEFLTS